MRRVAVIVLAVVGCGSGDDDPYYVEPGGGGGAFGTGVGSLPDAGSGGPDGGATIAGRVCLLNDPRSFVDCGGAGSGLDGALVQLGASVATAADDGQFMIADPGGTGLVWRVQTGTAADLLQESRVPYSTDNRIPVLRTDDYEDLLATHNVVAGAGEGSVFVRVIKAGNPLPGVRVSSPAAQGITYYAGADPAIWDTDDTDMVGSAWLTEVATSPTVTVTATPQIADGQPVSVTVPVLDQASTYVTVVIP